MSLKRLPFATRDLKVIDDLHALRSHLDAARARGQRIGLVPTMGNLHAGHLSLVARSREIADLTVATIFVNPFQFAPSEDFDTYPRTFDRDINALDDARCDVLFAPNAKSVYPHGPESATRVEVPELGAVLCGQSRPTFFRGVTTVVNILLNMVQPDVALFGEKDYQQLLVVRRMVSDLSMRVAIEAVPTVREADGLAMSSRNNYLTETERTRAAELYATLVSVGDALRSGSREYRELENQALERLRTIGFRPDYLEIRRLHDLAVPEPSDRDLIVLAAAWLGDTRLIDNLKVEPS